ncbi:MAG: hypothetical protein ACRDJ4_12940 [Actinomycetota bacterium]
MFEGTYQVLSYGFLVRTSVDAFARAVERTLAGFAADDAEVASTYRLVRGRRAPRFRLLIDGRQLRSSQSTAGAAEHLLWHVMRSAIETTPNQLLIHAGVVGGADGVVLLPGPSGCGKTTLVARLVGAGYRFLSDEIAVLDPAAGLVRPFPRALSVRPGMLELIELPAGLRMSAKDAGVMVPPEALRPGGVGTAGTPQLVISPSYESGSETRLEEVSSSQAVAMLASHAFNLESFGRRALIVLGDFVRGARCYRLRYGDVADAVRQVERLVRPPDQVGAAGPNARRETT